MAPLWMCEQTTPEIADSEAFNGNPLLRRPASTHGRPRESDRVRVGRELRVLVVDDQRDMADALARRVRRWGHEARMAHDGLAALRVAAAQHPDVVLLQMEIPFMDGHQIARHLRLDFPRKACFIIAVTERTEGERRQQCIESGIDLLLIKPIEPSVVETLLLLECELVNRRRALRADNNRKSCHETGGSSC